MGIRTRAAIAALIIIAVYTMIALFNPWNLYEIIVENTDYISVTLFSALGGATIVTLASGRR